ncbi:MAG: branched-chain amino acid ABC transporter permease [Actinobacteria bacterium]|nr:branched-chain amino acid ABC transporter permease [Actinomycetota bacterium]
MSRGRETTHSSDVASAAAEAPPVPGEVGAATAGADFPRTKSRGLFVRGNLILIVVLVGVTVFPIVFRDNGYFLHVATLIGIYSIMSLGLNLITGFTGILSFAQAAFAGVGAYTTALLLTTYGFPYMATIPLAVFVALLAGLLLALCTLRAGGLYFSVITIGFGEIFRLLVLNWQGFTGGATGIVGIPLPTVFGLTVRTPIQFYWLVSVFAVLSYLALKAIVGSRFGHAIKAIREDPIAASSAGVNVKLYSVLSFTLGAAFAGLGGNLVAVFLTTISPTNFTVDESMLIVVMNVVGGLGSLPGAVVGTGLLIVTSELLRDVYQWRLLLLGVLMVAMPLWRRGGILGTKLARRV